MSVLASFNDQLTAFSAPAAGGAALGAAAGYTAAAVAKQLGYDADYADLVGRGTGLGAIFGVALAVLHAAGLHSKA